MTLLRVKQILSACILRAGIRVVPRISRPSCWGNGYLFFLKLFSKGENDHGYEGKTSGTG